MEINAIFVSTYIFIFMDRNSFKIFVVAVIFCVFISNTLADNPLYFIRTNLHHNISTNSISSIAEDQYGFVWTAGPEGIYRYDGHDVQSFKSINDSIPLISENTLLMAENDNLWVTVWPWLGLFRINIVTMEVEKVDTRQIRTIYKDSKGKVWIGGTNVLWSLDQSNNKESYIHNKGLSDLNIRTIYEDSEGNMWIGTNNGLNRLKNGETSFECFFFENPLNRNPITVIIPEYTLNDDNLLIGTEYGLVIFNRHTSRHTILDEQSGLSNPSIRTLYSKGNKIWAGTDFGLNIIDRQTKVIQKYYSESGQNYTLPANRINQIVETRDGILWFATSSGLCYTNALMRNINFHKVFYRYQDILITSRVNAIVINNKNVMWGATQHGLFNNNLNNPNLFSEIKDDEFNSKLYQKNVYTLAEDSNGNLWIGTNGGIDIYNAKTHTITPVKTINKKKISPHYVGRLLASGNGDVFAAFWEGDFFQFQNNSLPQEDISGNIVLNNYSTHKFGIFENRLWFIKYNTLYKMSLETKHPEEVNACNKWLNGRRNEILFIDENGILYIGALGGVIQYNIQTDKCDFISINPNNNNNNDNNSTVINIIKDYNGSIWFTTQQSLFNVSGNMKAKEILRLTNDSPIQSFSRGASGIAPDGKVYLGGNGGYIYFHPKEMITLTLQDKNKDLYITAFKINDQTISANQIYNGRVLIEKDISQCSRIILNYDENNISLYFSSQNFGQSPGNSYTYILEGYDSEWQITKGATNYASYAKLPPGSYIFKVKINNNGINDEFLSALQIEIKRHTLTSNFMLLLYILLFLLILYYFYQLYVKRNKLKEELIKIKIEKQQENIISGFKIDFFTNLSHEIRTPVSLIASPINKILESEKLSDKSYKLLSLAKKNSERLLRTVNQLLDFRNIEERMQIQIAYEKVDITAFIRQIFLSFEEEAANNSIDFQFISMFENRIIYVDKNKLETILFNLISNALKYTKTSGSVTIQAEIRDENKIKISVSDTGVGISEADLPHIFNKFFRTSDEDVKHITGSGIGLSFVKKYIDALGGSINVESKKYKGSVFVVEIPFLYSIEQNSEIEWNNDDYTNPPAIMNYKSENELPTILYVEDNIELVEFVTLSLKHKYNIVIAYNGAKGCEKAVDTKPEVIISDVMMPEMDGVNMCKALKENKHTQHIPIIFLTAKSLMKDQIESIRAGVDVYITKPFEIDLLEANIDNILKRKIMMSEYVNKELVVVKKHEGKIESYDERFIRKISDAIDSHISDPDFNVQALSELIGISRNHLNRRIVAITNITISELIRKYRLRKASLLLRNKTGNIQEIMYYVGFQSSSYFSKCFQAEFGMSPKEYQSNILNKNTIN